MIVAAAVAVIAWGALAFGAVYPWAFKPLLVAAAAVGSCSLFLNRGRRLGPPNRAAMMALVCVLGAGLLQIVPLPARVLSTVSPSTDTFLRNHDLAYGLAAEAGDAPQPDGATSGSRWHPFSLAPRASVVSLAMLAAFTLFLAGLLRALTPSRARRLAAVVVAFGVLLALVGIVQKAVLGDHAWAGMKIYGFWAPRQPAEHSVRPVREQEPLRRLDADGDSRWRSAWRLAPPSRDCETSGAAGARSCCGFRHRKADGFSW